MRVVRAAALPGDLPFLPADSTRTWLRNGPGTHMPVPSVHLPPGPTAPPWQTGLMRATGVAPQGGAASYDVSLSVLSICNDTIKAVVSEKGAAGADITTYNLLDGGVSDPGPLDLRGWAPLPEVPDVLPWPKSPLALTRRPPKPRRAAPASSSWQSGCWRCL